MLTWPPVCRNDGSRSNAYLIIVEVEDIAPMCMNNRNVY